MIITQEYLDTFKTSDDILLYVMDHFLNQKYMAVVRGECRYRRYLKTETVACGIGCLIPKEKYTKKIEGKNVVSFLGRYGDNDSANILEFLGDKVTNLSPYNIREFFSSIQLYHDNIVAHFSLKKKMKQIWYEDLYHGLNYFHYLVSEETIQKCREMIRNHG